MSGRNPITAPEVVAAVRRRYGAEQDNFGPEWAALAEFGAWSVGRRCDLFLVRAWSGKPKGHERVVVEVKVSRADLRSELADPSKLAEFSRHAHRTYFAAPAGLVKDTDDLGEGIGLIEVLPGGSTRETRRSARRPDPDPLPEHLVVAAFRRAARAEARMRSADIGDPVARVVVLEAELTAARRAADTARGAADRDGRRLREWMSHLATAGGVPCVCGAPLRASRDSSYHRGHADGSRCPEGWAQPDFEALSVRLGLTSPTDHLEAAG